MTNGRNNTGNNTLNIPTVTATVKIKLSPSRAIITDTDVCATVVPNAIKTQAPPPPVVTAVIAPKVMLPANNKPQAPQPVIQVKQPTPTIINNSNNNKFVVPTTIKPVSATIKIKPAAAPAPQKAIPIRSVSTEEESSDPLESDLSEADVDEIEEEEEEVEEEEEEDEDEESVEESEKLPVDVVRQRKEFELDDFQMIKTIGTGTFGRVCLCRDKITGTFRAMKILAMADVIRLKQVVHVNNEKNILAEINHPFVVNMIWHTKDDCCLYMLFEYVCGGELFSYLRNAGRFNSSTANFYACEIVLALEYLHALSIVYRDLKPENLLLDRDGHLKITDFGFAKKLKDRTWTLCGTPEYLAPEIIQSKGHNKAVDWWALGVLIYEMLVGYPPFYDDNPFGIYEKILSGKTEWPRHMDATAKDLVKKLLVLDRTKRIGNMKNGTDDIKKHRWFKHLDWDEVYARKLRPPIVPRIAFEGDTSNFDEYPESDFKSSPTLDAAKRKLFEDF